MNYPWNPNLLWPVNYDQDWPDKRRPIMNIENLILERLERIETQLAPLTQNAKNMKELKDDLR